MKKLIFLFSLLTSSAFAAEVKMISLEQLMKTVQQKNNTLYVVNFWATWCLPCVAEMPYFEKAASSFQKNNIKIIFVSLDLKSGYERVVKFVKEKNITQEVLFLDAGNPDRWIDRIDKTWTGAIPATVYYKKGKKIAFHEGDYTQHSLDSTLTKLINKP